MKRWAARPVAERWLVLATFQGKRYTTLIGIEIEKQSAFFLGANFPEKAHVGGHSSPPQDVQP